MILKRSSLLSLLLLVANLFVCLRIYSLWYEGPWDLPGEGKDRRPLIEKGVIKHPLRPLPANTQNIISKSLFDPGRGARKIEEVKAADTSLQLAGNMVLIGTFITENERYAIIQLPSSPGRTKEQERFKLDDMVEGYQLSEIHEKKVVFKRGSSKIELLLDFFLKAGETGEKPGNAETAVPEIKPKIQQKSTSPTGTEKFLSNFGRFQNQGSVQGGSE